MANTILLKKSTTPNAVPLAGDLSLGELAINVTDGNLFYKNSATGQVTVIASNKFLDVSGNVSAAGNVLTAGQVSATGNVSGNYILGNITYATGYNATQIYNGTSNVNIASAGGNVTTSVGGTSNVVVVSTAGQYVTGVISANGTVTGGNFFTESDVTALGNVIAGNLVAPTAVVNLIKSDDSTVVGIDDGLEIYGSLLVNSNINAQDVIAANIIGGNVLTSTIRSDDSTVVNVDDGLEVHGPTRVNGTVYADDFVSNGNIAVASAVKRIVWVSSSAPSNSDGADGDIWFQIP